ncbi:MAG: TIGR04282 family arsenosugar biosynthesis glycosyltransferase [Maribacter sp.]|nr:TIGR04282 family arsenosugar biosynthesis glycosyltransferase [Maribacter sp.]
MSIILPIDTKDDKTAINDQSVTSENLLLIFTRNPVLGKCKTRLAATIGDRTALNIYKFLIVHTQELTKNVSAHKRVYYSEEIWNNDVWDNTIFDKRLQEGIDLGERMANAFLKGFEDGFKNIIIIGSDMYDLSKSDLDEAFLLLQKNDFVLGPAEDGGYYLLGMRNFKKTLFQNKDWGKENVFKNTMDDLKKDKVHLLKTKNDIDVYDDIKNVDAFKPYLKNL